MKNILFLISLLLTTTTFACGGGDYYEGMSFYNLFKQTNISAEEFYPFLRDESNQFYGEHYYYNENEPKIFPKGNIALWQEILPNWTKKEIENALYEAIDWSKKNTVLEKQIEAYIEFANRCSYIFDYRYQRGSWNYDEALLEKNIDTEALLSEANTLLKNVKNKQLKSRYYYQIIRIFHYSKQWQDAINYFENKIESNLPKNEIYYYILDQVAGCYYSTKNYEKSAYLFTKVLNNSIDRKKSAFISYLWCTQKGAEGKSYFTNGIEDQKDLLLIQSLRDFTDQISNINKFIALDANDSRVELLFMRALSNVERIVWQQYWYYYGNPNFQKNFPNISGKNNNVELLQIADNQIKNKVKNIAFWKIVSSYLSFIGEDIPLAQSKLAKVKGFKTQKNILATTYKVFSWETINAENENYIQKVLLANPKNKDYWTSENDWLDLILEKVAHTYFINNQTAKSFLVHNELDYVKNLHSLELLNDLEKFYLKTDKSAFESYLVKLRGENDNFKNVDFLDYINYQKGVYYLYEAKAKMALSFFEKNKSYKNEANLPSLLFSNNTIECFDCDEKNVMEDKVYLAKPYSFIKEHFNIKDLAQNLIALKKLTKDETQWKAKLANYLLGNYYFNISNTGYYRGVFTNYSNCCDYNYIEYDKNKKPTAGEIIKNKKNYNLMNIYFYDKTYYGLSHIAYKYYTETMQLSTDKELNARCLYLMAKCELNDYYNNGNENTFSIKINDYYTLTLPKYESFKTLEKEYSDTEFYDFIIGDCSYFKMYVESF